MIHMICCKTLPPDTTTTPLRIRVWQGCVVAAMLLCVSAFVHAEIPAIHLSSTAGKIKKIYRGAPSSKTVIVIQDIHGHTETQKSIATILADLKKSLGTSMRTIGIEGDIGSIDVQILRTIPDESLKTTIINTLCSKGYLTGPEAFASTCNDMGLYGMEDWAVYTHNMTQLKKGVIRYNGWEEEFAHCVAYYSNMKKRYNQHLKTVDALYNRYTTNGISLVAFCDALQREYRSVHHSWFSLKPYPHLAQYISAMRTLQKTQMDRVIDEKKALMRMLKNYISAASYQQLCDVFTRGDETEWNAYIVNILKTQYLSIRTAYPHLHTYLGVCTQLENSDFAAVQNELQRCVMHVQQNLARTQFEKHVLTIDSHLTTITEYLTNNISRSDYEAFESQRTSIFKLLAQYYKGSLARTQEKLAIMHSFYTLATKRSELLVSNLLAYPDDTLVFVVGGFYTDSVLAALRAMQCSYILITPNISSLDVDKTRYLSRLNGKVLEFDTPVIASCLYTQACKQEIANVLITHITPWYAANKTNPNIKDVIGYLVKVCIENNRERDAMYVILDLATQGYQGEAIDIPSPRERARTIAEYYGIDPAIITSVLGVTESNIE